jgi:CheY-like chemotaxis protein
MIEMLGRSLGPTIRITTDFRTGLVRTRVDPNQLELALLNLAVNARDAMPLGGDLKIAAYSEHIGPGDLPGLRPGDYVRILVEDTGCGMDEATLRRATEPFFTTKDRGRGTGLGLSMVDGLVAQSGGTMRIKSKSDAGTGVELWLPVTAEESEEPTRSATPSRAAVGRPFRALVVDDDAAVRAGTAAMIEDLGHSAIEAGSGASALALLRSQPDIDIVITDYAMPGMNGSELAAKIQRMRPGLPVVLATGYANIPSDLPALPRLNKPYRQQDLAALLASLVEQPLSRL